MAKGPIEVDSLKHRDTRLNIPTAEFESVMREDEKSPVRVAYERRNRDLDPQLVWRGKDVEDWSDLIVQAPPLYIQEKVHPKALIDDLRRQSKDRREAAAPAPDLFADFNGLKDREAATEFYQHDQHWSNRMIVGDSLAVMASLAEREGLRGKVQCIYFDPPYGIKFNSNFQWSTTSSKVSDGKRDQVTREPEQVRAFRDTWRDGIHSYLCYLRDRLSVARSLLSDTGSIFIQIGDENIHKVRAIADEIFGDENFIAQILFKKTGGLTANFISSIGDYILWYAKIRHKAKYRPLYKPKIPGEVGASQFRYELRDDGSLVDVGFAAAAALPSDRAVYHDNITSQGNPNYPFEYQGKVYERGYKASPANLRRVAMAGRFYIAGNTPRYVRKLSDFDVFAINQLWDDLAISGFADQKVYIVQTAPSAVQRCILMATDPGDLVLDPTCGSGTSAYVAEQWGRRWITIDTSRVAVALARSRLMGARYPYYLLADSPEGQRKEAEVTRTAPKTAPTRGDIRHGFVYERVPHITLKSIANNAEIDVIWEKFQAERIAPALAALGRELGRSFEEWQVPRELDPKLAWTPAARAAHADFWAARIARQKEIDASIAAKAEFEYLYDKPYVDRDRVRVAGPFTVESLSPHRTLAVDWNDELVDILEAAEGRRKAADPVGRGEAAGDFAQMILENLKVAGVQQAHKEDRITFVSLTGWPGRFVCAEGVFMEGETQRRAAIFVGPEFGTVARPDLVAAAREAGDGGFDVLIACAFNYDAHSAEFDRLGRVPVLKARMNPDLHMGADLKATGAGNLFVIFGEPDIKIHDAGDGTIRVQVFGVDVFRPQTGEVVSEGTDGIALWMLDTDYDEESFFVRHAYFLGANDPYKALKTTLKAEIDEEAWDSLYSDTSRPFPKPKSGRIAVKVINHLGDEVMKIFKVE